MGPILFYLLTAGLLALIGLLMSRHSLRFSFQGDRTLAFVIIFFLLFIILVLTTLSILNPNGLIPPSV